MATAYVGGDKASWLKQAYNRSYEKHPKIKAIVYLDTDEPFITAATAGLATRQAGRRLGPADVPEHRRSRPKFQGTIP